MMTIDTPPASDDEHQSNLNRRENGDVLPAVSNNYAEMQSTQSTHNNIPSFNSPPSGFKNNQTAAAMFQEHITPTNSNSRPNNSRPSLHDRPDLQPQTNYNSRSQHRSPHARTSPPRRTHGGSYMDESESSLSTTDDLDDFHKVQLDTLTQENDAKQAALEEMTHRYHKLHDRSVNYESNLRDRDSLIAQLSKELTGTKDKIMKVKKQLKERGLNSLTASEMGDVRSHMGGDTVSMDGTRLLRMHNASGRQSAMSEFDDFNYSKLQTRLQFSEEQLAKQTGLLEKIKADLGLPQGIQVNEDKFYEALNKSIQNLENADPRVSLRNNQLHFHNAHTQSDFSPLPTLLDHTTKPDYKKDSKATNGIDEEWIAEHSNSNASSAIIQIRQTPRPETREMATNTEKIHEIETTKMDNMQSNNNNTQSDNKNNNNDDQQIRVNLNNFDQNLDQSDSSLPDSPRLQEEILMLENEVEQGKEALRLFANETQQEKNKLNCRINDLEDELAEKDKLNYDNQHEMEQLVDEALLKEQELTDLKTMLNSHDSQEAELEELKEKIDEQATNLEIHENLRSEVVKIRAAFEAEQAKVKELQVQLDIQESVVMNLGDTDTSVPSTPVNSPRAPENNNNKRKTMLFPEKIAQLEQTIIIAQRSSKIQRKNDQCQEELLKNIQHIGDLERQLEYYRLGLSPTPCDDERDGFNNEYNNTGNVSKNLNQGLLKAQEEQIENLSSRFQHSQQQHTLALETIENMKSQNDHLKSENVEMANQINKIGSEKFRLDTTLAQNNALKQDLSEQDKNIRVILSSKEVEVEELKRKLEIKEKLLLDTERLVSVKRAEFTAAVSPMASPRTPPEFNDSYLNKSMGAQLSVALEEKDRMIEILRAGKDTLSHQNNNLSDQVAALNRQIRDHESSCSSNLANSLQHQQFQNQQYQNQQYQDQQQLQSQQQLQNQQFQNQHLNEQILELETKLRKSDSEKSNLNSQNLNFQTQNNQLSQTVNSLKLDIQRLESEIKQLNNHLSSTQDQLNRVNQLSSNFNENDRLEKLDIERKLDQVVKEKRELEIKLTEELYNIEQNYELKLQNQKNSLESKLEQTRFTLNEMSSKYQESQSGEFLQEILEQKSSECEDLSSRFQKISEEKELLKTKLSNKNAQYEAAQQRNDQFEELVKDHEQEIENLEAEALEQIQTEAEKFESEIEQLKSYIETLEGVNRPASTEPDNPDFNALKVQIEDLLNKQTIKDDEVDVGKVEIGKLETRLMQCQDIIKSRNQHIEQLEYDLNEKLAEIMALESPRDNLRNSNENLKYEIDCLKMKAGDAVLKVDNLSLQVNDLISERDSLQNTLNMRGKSFAGKLKEKEDEIQTLFRDNENVRRKLDEAENFSSMARRLTAVQANDMSLGDTTFEGSILIDGEVPAGLAQLLKEVHKEGVTVMHLAEQQEKQQAETANSDAILVHLQRLQEVLTSKDSNETIVGLFKDFEQNITSDRENMLKEIKKFALKVENTAADSNMFNPTVNADSENNNVGEIVNRLENIAMKLQDSRNSNQNTPRKGPDVEMINQFQQVSPNRVVSIEDYNMLQTRFAHLQQRMEAISMAKPDEQTILESFRQRIVSILANINILMTTPVSSTSLTELDQSRMEVNSVFEELQKFNILSLVNSPHATNTNGFSDSVLSSSNDYLKKCNKELTDRCCIIENKARRIAGSVSDLENSIRSYQKKCHDLKIKAKNSTFQANTLYNKLVRSDQYKRALGFQKRYFLMRLESESNKIDLAMQIVSDLINDLPDYMRNKYSNQFTIIKRGLSNGRSPGKNNSGAFNKPALSKYSSTRQLNSGLTDQAKKRRARRNWRVLIITARATARMKILCRRSVRTKVCADQKFNLSQFEDEDDLIYDFDLNFDQKLNFQQVQMQQQNISPRQHITSPMQHQGGYQTLQNPLRSPLQNMRSPPQFQRSNSEQVGHTGFAVPASPATSFGNQNAFGGSMVVHHQSHHQSPVSRQLFSSHSALNNMPNTSNATTVTPIRETGHGLRETVIQADWARHRGNSAGLDDGRGGLVSQNSTPGRLSTGLADYQNISSHHYSNSNLAPQPFTPTTNATYTNLQNFPNSYSTQNF